MFKFISCLCMAALMSAAACAQTVKKFIDSANKDFSVKPGDNFYLYANGNWVRNTPVPAAKTRWGSFDQLSSESSAALKGLLTEAAATPGENLLMKRVGDYYASGMDSFGLEIAGYQEIKPFLLKVRQLQFRDDITETIGYLRNNGITSALINVNVRQDAQCFKGCSAHRSRRHLST